MATARIDTGGAVTSSSTKNNRSTVKVNGNSAASDANIVGNVAGGLVGAQFPLTSTFGLHKTVTAGTIYGQDIGNIVVRKITTTIAGVANTVLQTGASDYGQRRSVHGVNTIRSTFLQSYSWTTDSGGNPIEIAYTGVNRNYNTTFADDSVLANGLAAPGQITYKTGAATPVNDDYDRM